MNWEEIKEKYPKAYNKSQPVSNGRWFRYLYDFFDENGIYIELVRVCDFWYYLGCLKAHDTRTEAEEGAFIEAFKMLERKLNK